VPPGAYEATFVQHETDNKAFGGTPKIYLHFQLMDPGFMEKTLYKAYNVKELIGKPGRNGKFKLNKGQDLTLLLCKIDPTVRLDRISLRLLSGCSWNVSVRTVTKDYKQRELPEQLQYSVIDEILSKAYGG
jgi:hypothetical protein